ncbi:MAG TPA: hypothetical protein DHV31_01885 [Clostridiales bacterium]|nr:hypothetical protein [Clostridiales bacterium]
MPRKRTIWERKMEIIDVVKLLKSAKIIALFSHINPDCDTIGSTLALRAFLQKAGKTVSCFCDGELKFDMGDLYSAEAINQDAELSSYDLTIAVDCAAEDRIGKYVTLFKKGRKTLCVDHHLQDRSYAMYNCIDPHSGATAELIWLIIKEYDLTFMDVNIASLLYTALVTDTGNFGFSNTGVRTLEIASSLLQYGIPNADISYKHFREIPFDTFKLKARVLSKAQFFEQNRIGILTFTKEDFVATGTSSANTSNLVNEIVNVAGVDIAVSITEVRPNGYKISVRTQGNVDANAIASVFGGGGHKNASGFMVNGFYGNVLDDILKACKDHL